VRRGHRLRLTALARAPWPLKTQGTQGRKSCV